MEEESKFTPVTTTVILIIIVCFAWYFLAGKPLEAPTSDQHNAGLGTASTTPEINLKTYTDPNYHFEISYQDDFVATTTFARYYHVVNSWRQGVGFEDFLSGLPIVSIYTAKIINRPTEDQYYFISEVRIGESANKDEVANCLKKDTHETLNGNEVINGVTFNRFTSSSAGMSQYADVSSFRAVHENICFAIESIITGGGTGGLAEDISHSKELIDISKREALAVIKTFRFVK